MTYSHRYRGNKPQVVALFVSGGASNSMSRATVIGLPTDDDSLGPAVSYLTLEIPQDPIFRPLLSYRRYRLKDRSRYVAPEDIGHRGRRTKSLKAAMEKNSIHGE